jgi:hypothetical protein
VAILEASTIPPGEYILVARGRAEFYDGTVHILLSYLLQQRNGPTSREEIRSLVQKRHLVRYGTGKGSWYALP